MLKKLLKYDLKYMLKNMLVFYILTIFFALVIRVLSLFNETIVITVIKNISLGCLIAMIINILINTMMRSWVRFRESLYKDEAYLTHTLPVTKKDIYESKFIQTLIFSLVGFVVILLSIFIAYYTKDNFNTLKNLINSISTSVNISTAPFIIGCIIALFVEIINAIQTGFLGIIIGHRSNNNKIVLSVLFGFIIYEVGQVLILAVLVIYGLIDREVINIFISNEITNVGIIKTIFILLTLAYVALVAATNIISVKLLNKGIDID